MANDKYTATWVSHSSIGDFLKCPRAYYLRNVYKDPRTGHKIQLMSPPLALGQAIHEVLESLSPLPKDKRFGKSLIGRLEQTWQKISGEKGGFNNKEEEEHYRDRGKAMLGRVTENPGPLKNLAVRINMDLPHFWLSEEDSIILCGKIDWLEYLSENRSVHIIDFKTGRQDEPSDSLQLPIYNLLATSCQSYPVAKMSYWYLDRNDGLIKKDLLDFKESHQKVLKVAKKIKLARQLGRFICSRGDSGCSACRPMEAVLRGEGKLVGENKFGQDVYVLNENNGKEKKITEIIL